MGRQSLIRSYAGRMRSRPALVSAGLVALVLLLIGLTLPVRYVELVPGPVTNTLGKRPDGTPIITVKGRATYPTSGHLDLTTVGVRGGPSGQLTLAQAVVGWFDRQAAVLPQDVIYPPGESEQVVEQQNTQEMVDSQQEAITAALTNLKVPFRIEVMVALVSKGTPADGRLKAGDVITSVDGSAVTNANTLRTLIGRRTPGQSVSLGILRAGKALRVVLITIPDPQNTKRPIIGVSTTERPNPPFTVAINLKDVGGPSAGLMFTLGIIDTLTPGELNGGRHIAGTGTIDTAGKVGPIGGVAQKVVAARHVGATVFLTPVENCAAAKRNRPGGLQLVRVASLSDALSRLADLRAGRPVPTC